MDSNEIEESDTTAFLGKRVCFELISYNIECIVLGVIEEPGCIFYYEVLLDGGQKYYIATSDVSGVSVFDNNPVNVLKACKGDFNVTPIKRIP